MKNIFHLLFICFFLSITNWSCESRSANNSRSKSGKAFVLLQNGIKSESNNSNSIQILTWNIQELGHSKNSEEIASIIKIINLYDIVAVQEVVAKDPRGAQTVAKIVDELNRMGSKWDYSISDPTKSPSNNMSERYAYLWKTSKASSIKKPYLDKELKNICVREPYVAAFKLKKSEDSFFLVNFHAKVHSQRPEEEIKYFIDYPERLKSENIIILGDFNLNEEHIVWKDFYRLGFKSAIQKSPTTLKRKCKRKKYLYHSIDNIYYNSMKINLINSGRIDFVVNCDNLKNARHISDHLPVFMEFQLN